MTGPIVVCGARGFVGSHLVERLTSAGYSVRAGSRRPGTGGPLPAGAAWVRLDVEDPESLRSAFEGASAVVYLVHHLRETGKNLEEQEAASAWNVRAAAESAGVERIVYLGGPEPAEGPVSHHLAARLKTGEILRGGSVSGIELRAGMVVGAGSESWMICRDLAMRLPVMVLPRWLSHRSEPIGIHDVTLAIQSAVERKQSGSSWFDLPGPEALSGRQILERVAAQQGRRPLMVPVPVLTPSLSSHWIRLVTRADYAVARYLVDGLTTDLLATGPSFWDAIGAQPEPFDEAVRRALADEDPDALGRLGRALERLVALSGLPA